MIIIMTLQVMENIMKSGGVVSEDLIKILAEHCRDSSLMVRKLMVGSLTELVKVMSVIVTSVTVTSSLQ